jgi:glycosyltransferase involved in cell wall biosynthesis
MFWLWMAYGVLLAAVWLAAWVSVVRGLPRVANISRPEWDREPEKRGAQPSVLVVVPARNEGVKIEQCLRSLVALDYSNYSICAVDDRSEDATGRIMDALQQQHPDKLRVIHVHELPEDWLGKTHAMWAGAQSTPSDWILFTDGDIFFQPASLRRAMNYAETARIQHVVLFPAFHTRGFGERMGMGVFQLAFALMFRPYKVADPKARDFAGVGAFNLVERRAYEAIGTYRALRMEVIDDLMLGREIKRHGFVQHCVFGGDLVSVRWAEGWLGIARNLRKNMFSLLRFSWMLALLATVATAVLHVGPWIGIALAPGIAKLGFFAAVAGIALVYASLQPFFRVPWFYFLTQPLGALFSIYTLLQSAFSSVYHGGVMWRGTVYPVARIQRVQRAARLERDRG